MAEREIVPQERIMPRQSTRIICDAERMSATPASKRIRTRRGWLARWLSLLGLRSGKGDWAANR